MPHFPIRETAVTKFFACEAKPARRVLRARIRIPICAVRAGNLTLIAVASLPRLLQEARLSFSLRTLIFALMVTALPCAAEGPTKASLDVSETLFSIVAAANVCGYDQDLASSSPIRQQVRADLVKASESPQAASAAQAMCRFYRDHKQERRGARTGAVCFFSAECGQSS